MALSLDSKIRDIMRSEEGKAVMEKMGAGFIKGPPHETCRCAYLP